MEVVAVLKKGRCNNLKREQYESMDRLEELDLLDLSSL